MPSKKKRKTNHQDLTHEEIWDDSALLRSWQHAVEEYKFYHSIDARGEDVEEVLRRVEAEETNGQKPGNDPADDSGDEGEIEDDVVQDSLEPGGVDEEANGVDDGELDVEDEIDGLMANIETEAKGQTVIQVPSSLPGSDVVKDSFASTGEGVKTASSTGQADQTLENVKMAYYWAGYYSGLYDGQRSTGK